VAIGFQNLEMTEMEPAVSQTSHLKLPISNFPAASSISNSAAAYSILTAALPPKKNYYEEQVKNLCSGKNVVEPIIPTPNAHRWPCTEVDE
jgi:hypothetical protein